MKKKQKIKLLQTCRTVLPPRPIQQRGPGAQREDVLAYLGVRVLESKWIDVITITNTLTHIYPNTFPVHYPGAQARQRQSGKGAAECGWFLALRFLTPSFSKKDGNNSLKEDEKQA